MVIFSDRFKVILDVFLSDVRLIHATVETGKAAVDSHSETDISIHCFAYVQVVFGICRVLHILRVMLECLWMVLV